MWPACAKRSKPARAASAFETTEIEAPVSMMKLTGFSSPSKLTSPLQKPLEVVRMGTSIAPTGGATAAAREGLQAHLPGRLFGDDAHARARVHDEAQRLLRAVDADVDDGAAVDQLERERDGVGAADREQVPLLAEVAQEVDEAADARAAVGVGLRRDAEEGLVGVGRLLVALVARGDLAEVEDVVGLVGVDEGRAPEPREALR